MNSNFTLDNIEVKPFTTEISPSKSTISNGTIFNNDEITGKIELEFRKKMSQKKSKGKFRKQVNLIGMKIYCNKCH